MPEQNFFLEHWQPITALVGAVLSALSTFGIFGNPRARGRAKLKLDLEIHKLMSESQASWEHMDKVKGEIEGLSQQIYASGDWQVRGIYIAIGIVFAGGFGWWTYDILVTDAGEFSFSWWSVLTVYWTLVGFSMVFVGATRQFSHKMVGTPERTGDTGGQSAPAAGAAAQAD